MRSLAFSLLRGGQSRSHLVQYEDFAILLDCGWTDAFKVDELEPIIKVLDRVDAVILSHPDLHHLGALIYLIAKCGLKAPVYSTLPVRRMGELFMTEALLAKQAESDFDLFGMEEVRQTFLEHPWFQLRYSQLLHITEGRLSGLQLTPYNAGRMVGGAIWKLVLPDGSDLIYALDWCHKRERHLNMALLSHVVTNRPALVIAGVAGCLSPTVNLTKRDTELLDVILTTLRGDGSVLIPVDAAGRVLELVLLLEEFWSREKMAYPVVLLSRTCKTMLERAQQQLEYMSNHIGDTFGTKRSNPFNLSFVKPMCGPEELGHLPAGPKVVLAGSPNLDTGFSRNLFLQWASDEKNTICFVERPEEGSLSDQILKHVPGPEPLVLRVERVDRVPLQGQELDEYMIQRGQAVEVVVEEEMLEEDESADEALETVEHSIGMEGASGETRSERDADVEGRKQEAEMGEAMMMEGIISWQVDTTTGTLPAVCEDVEMRQSMRERFEGLLALRRSSSLLSLSCHVDEDGLAVTTERRVLTEGFDVPQGSSHAMYPDEDEPMLEVWDAYGMVSSGIHMEANSSLLQSYEPALNRDPNSSVPGISPQHALRDAVDMEEEEVEPEVPTKLLTETIVMVLTAAVRFFDYSARVDARTLNTVLVDIAPRTLMLVGGTDIEVQELSRQCSKGLSDLRTVVLCPAPGSTAVQVPLPRAVTMYLSDALDEEVAVRPIMQRYAVAQLEAVIAAPDPHHPSFLQLQPSGEPPSGEDVFIADSIAGVQLSLVKEALATAGLQSVFQGRKLVCGHVSIFHNANDKAHLILEGALCEEFDKIKEVIYAQYSVC
ncbi:hypothetical protein CEUSTIGMA_g7098.t1 [Chlamydomonas eustigma]|uniref:Cleavage and polyadenylation specificity factor subunit 2 n=1 Tax=Chlamydomonas eustigma TaxID=1157962 RepID=A0A250X9C2_9CHLO|nr:hypothetical protein CEUSTIGMA_g7098.t1 [Chlamydomonas eustigma]|eukprot:GAX79657.1 hypothetical protein CEUSTIGMA_g7098.t1 [Chlamydomonas eustigma]